MIWLEWLRPALVDATEEELLCELRAGRAQLWFGETAAVVTQCIVDGEGRSVHVWLAGGDLAGVMALRPGIEAWGRAQGCLFISIDGRTGWRRVLRSHGYVHQGSELKRMLQ